MDMDMDMTPPTPQKDFNKMVANFLHLFELVFDDDWTMTKECLADPTHLIAEDGTFLDPQVPDESNNWHNRGVLLAAYRELRAAPPPVEDV